MPFIVRWPGVTPPGEVDATTVVGAVDMYPTLCRLAGVETQTGVQFDGVDRSDAFKGHAIGEREQPLMWEYGRNAKFFGYPKQPRDRSPQLAIREGNWKLLCNANGEGVELYDFSLDKNEDDNVAAEHPEVVGRLQKELLACSRACPSKTK